MPPLFGGRSQRHAQILAHPANKAKALSSQQQGGQSGQIPGTSTSPYQVAVTHGMIQTYPALAPSPNGGQVAGVGHAVLNNDGDPVVVMGNLNAVGGSDHADFEDGGFAFLDAAGNQVAGYSQPTGLWGFGGGGLVIEQAYLSPPPGYTLPCDGASHSVAVIDSSPPAWIDTSGNLTVVGVFTVGLTQIKLATAATTPGLFAHVFSAFSEGWLIPFDGLTALAAMGSWARLSLYSTNPVGPGEPPVATTMFVTTPTDATATLFVQPFVRWVLGYP